MKPRLYVVVPMLNEAGNITSLMASLEQIARELGEQLDIRIILVDDGSSDGTADQARRHAGVLALEIITHAENRGPGAAFGSAFASLAGRLDDHDWVVTIEGDNTSRLELLKQMLTRAREGFDVVLASPYLYGGGITNTSTFRVVLSEIANGFVTKALGLQGIVTMSSFFRLYRGSALTALQRHHGPRIIERVGFESMIELLVKMVALGFSISEVAMRLDTSRRVGKSKMRIARTALGYLTLWRDKQRWVRARPS